MSTTYLPPVPGGTEQGPPWPGAGGPGGGEPGGGAGGGPRRRRHRLLAVLIAVVLVFAAAAAGAAWAAGSAATRVLTTAQITAKVSPALVNINTTLGYQHGSAAGTGMVLTSSGEILTNNHVVEGATSITATDVGNGRTYQAKVLGYNEQEDIAVLQLQGASGLKTVSLGNSSAVKVGQHVVALGNAGGKGGAPSVVTGQITGLNQNITASDRAAGTSEQLTGLIRTDAGIQAGDSGGPLVNTAGEVIGMNTAASTSYQFVNQGQNRTQAFAIPIGEAHSTAGQIEAGQASATVHIGATAFLGVGLTSASGQGAGVVQVVSGSPADQAGLVPGDVIQSLGGHQVTSPADVQSAMVRHHPGDRVSITWADQVGQSHTASVTLVAGPAG